jgi:hypothetical protein
MDIDEPDSTTSSRSRGSVPYDEPNTTTLSMSLDSTLPYEGRAQIGPTTRDSTPYTHTSLSSAVDLDNNSPQREQYLSVSSLPCFKIIYVPDPTRATTPTSASADLAFIKTTITSQEYMSMKHLTGSVHYKSRSGSNPDSMKYTVYMQEWVCKI